MSHSNGFSDPYYLVLVDDEIVARFGVVLCFLCLTFVFLVGLLLVAHPTRRVGYRSAVIWKTLNPFYGEDVHLSLANNV